MYVEAKHSFMKYVYLLEEKAGMGPDARLEPAWMKLAGSSYRTWCVQHGSQGVMNKKLNHFGLYGLISLCNSCWFYRHLLAECPDSW